MNRDMNLLLKHIRKKATVNGHMLKMIKVMSITVKQGKLMTKQKNIVKRQTD